MRSMGATYGVLLACMISCQSWMRAQDLKVLVLDALDGKPQAHVEVEYFCTRIQHNSEHKKALTNDEGWAKVSNFCSGEEKVEISVYPLNKKEQCGDDAVMALDDVVSVGFLSKPDSAGGIWCPTRVSRTLKPVPGQVILFIKRPTWWQSHVAG